MPLRPSAARHWHATISYMNMTSSDYKSYKGNNESHRLFWRSLDAFPPEQHILAFLDFFAQIKIEVENGACSLRNAGYALAPGQYDDAMQHIGGVTIGCGAAEDLAEWIYVDIKEAHQDWQTVIDALEGLARK